MNPNDEEKYARAKRFAEIYLYEHCGNLAKSYLQLMEERNDIVNKNSYSIRSQAHRYFQLPYVQEAVAKEREAAQAAFDVRKEEIVSNLKEIAFNSDIGNKDRLAALKQLTDIGGFATQKLNLDAKANIEVVIE